jgi:hypothetical protein
LKKKDEPEEGDDETEPIKLEKKDYLALAIAALETILLPVLVLVAVLLILVFLIR